MISGLASCELLHKLSLRGGLGCIERMNGAASSNQKVGGYSRGFFWQGSLYDCATARRRAAVRIGVISGETAGVIAAAPKEQPPRKLSGKRTVITGEL